MRYSDKACSVGEPQLRSKSCADAFSHFTRVLSRYKALVDMLHTARQKTGNQAALDQPPSDDRTGVKVYVLPVPDALTDELVTCYREKRGENPWDDTQPHGNCDGKRTCDDCDRGNECSEALGVETAQHASDIWLHRGLLKHSNRVKDPAEADVIFVPFYGGISYELGECNKLTHQQRVELLAHTIDKSELWHSGGLPGWRFAVPITHWHVAATLQSPLRELLLSSRAVVITQDPYFFDGSRGLPNIYGDSDWRVEAWGGRAFDDRYTVTVPYPSLYSGGVNPSIPDVEYRLQPRAKHAEQGFQHMLRPTLVQFRGNTDLASCKLITKRTDATTDGSWALPTFCNLRRLLVDSAKESCSDSDLDIEDVDKLADWKEMSYNDKFATNITYVSMRKSVFCLVPRGDTPSSRRLFDAVSAGCIPVIISDDYTPAFQSALNYSRFSLRFPVEEVLADPCKVFGKLRMMDKETVTSLQEELKVAMKWLSYGPRQNLLLQGALPSSGAIDLALSAVAAAHAKQQEAGAYVLSAPCGTWKGSAHPEAIDAHADEVPEPLETSELFLIFSRPRSESTVLCNHLNQQPDITMLYDVFRESSSFTVDPFGIRKLRCDIGYCEDASWRADLPGFLHALSVRCPTRLCGIRMFDDQAASLDLNQLFAELSAIQSKQKWQRTSANYRKPANYRSPSPSTATVLRLAATGACGDWCEENGATLQQGDEKCGYEACSACKGCTGDHAAEKKQMSKADDLFCSQPDLWCVHEGAMNQRKRCGGQLGHFCSDEQGDSGFSPCECAEGGPSTEHPGGPCSTWGQGLTCEGYTLPDDDASPPADNTAAAPDVSATEEDDGNDSAEAEPDDSAEAEPVFAGTGRFILLEQEVTAEYDAVSVQGLAGEDWGGTVCGGVDRQGLAIDVDELNPGLEYNAFAAAHKSWFERVRAFEGGELLELTTNQLVGDAEATTRSALSFLGVTPNSDVDVLAPWDDCSTQGGGLEDKLVRDLRQKRERRARVGSGKGGAGPSIA